MRVLLLGATGNLGRRVVPALVAHNHTVVIYVRNIPKLQSLISASLLELVHAVVEGDATDSEGIKKVLVEYSIEGIINVAGNQVLPWKEHALQKIAKAVTSAAVSVGQERGTPLRAWITSGIGILQYPGTPYLFQDYGPRIGMIQHIETEAIVSSIPTTELKWSLYASAMMTPAKSPQGPFQAGDVISPHDLLVTATSPPEWENSWVERIPIIGPYLWIWPALIWSYRTKYEAVADFLAGDLENGKDEWIGLKIGVKEKREKKDV